MASPSAHRCSRLCLRLVLILLVLSTMLVLFSTVVFLLNPSSSSAWSLGGAQHILSPPANSDLRTQHQGCSATLASSECIHGGPNDEWNIFYHLGGNGPWIQKVDDVVEGGFEAPKGCQVDMIHMVRYFTNPEDSFRRLNTSCRCRDMAKGTLQ